MRISDWRSDVCSSDLYDAIYEKALVLNPHLDKWSSFDERFYGLLPIVLTQSQREGDYFGFVDDQGIVKFWRQTGSREIAPSDDTLNLFYPLTQKPYWKEEEGTRINVCRSEEHTSELQSLMRSSYAVLCLKKKKNKHNTQIYL